MHDVSYTGIYQSVLEEINQALEAVDSKDVELLIEEIMKADHVFIVGVGRVMLSLSAFAKRLHQLGIRTHCVGDINEPAIRQGDLLLVASGSGESAIPVVIANIAKGHRARIAHIGSNPQGSVTTIADVFVRIPVTTKLGLTGEIPSQQIMTSLFEQALYILGDAIALSIARRRNIKIEELWQYHANLE